MNWNFEEADVVILGAGFSASLTNGNMPLMRSFFDKLSKNKYSLLYDFIEATQGDPKNANVENVLLSLDQIQSSPKQAIKEWGEKWKDNCMELYSEVSDYILERLSAPTISKIENWPAEILWTTGLSATYISMNYDVFAERILSGYPGVTHCWEGASCPHCKLRFLAKKACSCNGKYPLEEVDWKGSILKPHGSISWRRCLNSICCSYQCIEVEQNCRPYELSYCNDCEQICRPVLIVPSMQKNLSEIPEISIMWKASYKAIAAARNLLIFGFSLPKSDELFAISVRAALNSSRVLEKIAVIDLNPSPILERFRAFLPAGYKVEEYPFVVESSVRPSWFPELIP